MNRSGEDIDETGELTILKAAVDNANEAFVTIDDRHMVILFNRSAEKMFGYARTEVIGRDLNHILSPTCSKNHKEAVARYINTRVPSLIGHGAELSVTRHNGETFPAFISFSVAEISGHLYFTALVRDLTETKAFEEKIARQERLAAVGQAVAEIVHEIKNPLLIIGGFARQLKKSVHDEKSLSKIDIIAAEVIRLEKLLAELRELYRARSLSLESFDLQELLKEVYLLMQEAGAEKQIRLSLATESVPLMIQADKDKLKQVLINLIENSLEALVSGGNITIKAKRSADRRVAVSIIDDGPGISPEVKAKIFEPLFTTKKTGTGLGLSISKRIIEDHPDSALKLDSEAGHGTEAKILMPLAAG